MSDDQKKDSSLLTTHIESSQTIRNDLIQVAERLVPGFLQRF